MDTEPKTPDAVDTAGQVDTKPTSAIEYYPAEGEEETGETPVAEQDVGDGIVAGQTPAQAPIAEAAKPPPLPSVEPSVLSQYQAVLGEQQRFQEQQAQELSQLRLNQELSGLRGQWTAAGYDEDQIQQGLKDHRQVREREQALAVRERTLDRVLSEARANDEAKVHVATFLSEKYGMPVAALMQFGSPQLMEAKAEAFKAKAELAKALQSRVKPVKMASVGPGSQGTQSIANLRAKYAAGQELTQEQKQAIGLYR